MQNLVNIYSVVIADRQGPPPLVINVETKPRTMEFAGGVPASSVRNESYILLSALPDELRERVRTAIQALQAGM